MILPQVLTINPAQYEALGAMTREVFARRLIGWLAQDDRTASQARTLAAPWALDVVAAAEPLGVTDEEDVFEFAVLRLLAPAGAWRSPSARDILDSERSGTLKVFQLGQLFKPVLNLA